MIFAGGGVHSSVLRYLVEVARHGSIRKAAAALNVASSGVNQRILTLEKQLGVVLFVRSPHGMVPTSAGLRLLKHAEQTLSEFEALRPMFSEYRDMKLGHVRVACESWLGGYLLPQLAAVFSASHPKVTMSVYQLSSGEVIQAIDDGHAEIGIAGAYEQRHTVRLFKTIQASCGAIVARGHPLAGRASVSLEEVLAFPLVQFGRPGRADFFLSEVLAQQAGPHQVSYSTNSFDMAEAIISSGNAVGILPCPGRMLEGAPELAYVAISQPELRSHRYGIFIPTNRHLDAIERRLIAAVSDILAEDARAPQRVERSTAGKAP